MFNEKEYKKEYRIRNREKIQKSQREWEHNNAEHCKKYRNNYWANHKLERLINKRKCKAKRKGASGSHTKQDELSLLSLQRGLCYYCGKPMEGTPHLEHMTPIVKRGGTDNPENLCFSCAYCNHHKENRTAEEYLAIEPGAITVARIFVDKWHKELLV